MGIPYYFYKLREKYRKIIIESEKKSVDYLFFDFNSLLHPSSAEYLKTSENETTLEMDIASIKYSLEYTMEIIERVNPVCGVWIVLDGVAPMAKMKQQRQRRFKSYYIEKRGIKWDSNKITPGTKYMYKLDEMLNNFIDNLNKEAIKNGITRVYNYNSWLKNGEGEHKIYKILKELSIESKSVYIYGMDADLIVLSLLNDKNDITLFRDKSMDVESVELVDIGLLRGYIIEDLRGSRLYREMDMKRLVNDYILLMCFMGNDFLDNVPTLSILDGGLDIILDIYRKNKEYITKIENGIVVIDYRVLLKILYKLETSELYVYKKWCNKVVKFKDDIQVLENNDNIIVYNDKSILSGNARENISEVKNRYYIFYDIWNISDCCESYKRGLEWIMGYYNGHSHNNWSYVYNHSASPFISDIIEYIRENIKSSIVFKETKPVEPIEQLLIVLPRETLASKDLLGDNDYEKIKRVLNIESIDKYFDKKMAIDYINKDVIWKGRVFLDIIKDVDIKSLL
jgi:5'-3' exonuclease